MPMVASSVGAAPANWAHPDAPSSLMEVAKHFSQASPGYAAGILQGCLWLGTPEMSQSFETRRMQIARAAWLPGTGLKVVGYQSLPSIGGTSCLQAVVSALVAIANQWGTRLGLAEPCSVQTLMAAVPQQAPGEGPRQPPGTSPTASNATHLHSHQALQPGSGCFLQNKLPSSRPTAPAPAWVEPTGRKTKTAK